MNTFFWILWYVVALGTMIFYYFFFVGLSDGSISGFNSGIWSAIVIGFPILLIGTYWLKNNGWLKLATLLVSIPAFPMIGYMLFFAAMIFFGPKNWN